MIKQFLNNKSGNFAAMFAAVSIPLIGGVAMTIEYANLSNNQQKLQNTVDAATLFVGKHYIENGKLPQVKAFKDFIDANFEGTLSGYEMKVVGDEVVVSADTRAPDFFFGKVAPDVFNQSADASVPIGQNALIDIALVLDTTRSMSVDGKLDSLKIVAADFIDTMNKASSSSTNVKIGIVPFSNHVNVGLSRRSASWIDVPPDETETKEVCRNAWPAGVDMTCVKETRYEDGAPYEVTVCDPTDPNVTMITTCAMETQELKWYGCVGSRNDPYMVTDGAYATRMPGLIEPDEWHCPSELTPLTDQVATLKAGIQALTDRGETYIAPGVMWGLRLLSPGQPFTEGRDQATAPADTAVKKIMIVMTDGDNSRGSRQPWDPANWEADVDDANLVTKQACTAARDAGVTVYTIAFGTTISAAGQAVMQECAGDASRYFPAADAAALNEAFKTIGAKITTFRLAS